MSGTTNSVISSQYPSPAFNRQYYVSQHSVERHTDHGQYCSTFTIPPSQIEGYLNNNSLFTMPYPLPLYDRSDRRKNGYRLLFALQLNAQIGTSRDGKPQNWQFLITDTKGRYITVYPATQLPAVFRNVSMDNVWAHFAQELDEQLLLDIGNTAEPSRTVHEQEQGRIQVCINVKEKPKNYRFPKPLQLYAEMKGKLGVNAHDEIPNPPIPMEFVMERKG